MNGEASEVKVKVNKRLYKDPVIWLYLVCHYPLTIIVIEITGMITVV
jgi:hypothetical protein